MPFRWSKMFSLRESRPVCTMNMMKLIQSRLLDDFLNTHNVAGTAFRSDSEYALPSHNSWITFLDCGVIGGWTMASAGRCTQLTIASGHGLLICADRVQSITDGRASPLVSVTLFEPGDM